ncbi:PAS domain S-box protein [Sorangium sp. So ce726]|uniref:PAS domain-containing hybrid sensor histidine kinase/response regulator n=1 Tax=Sorangium sp. So ce726 TaxID=3133319 RepID=UPI003F5D7B46
MEDQGGRRMGETAGQPVWATRSPSRGTAQIDASSGRLLHVSSSLCQLLGYSEDELRQKKLSDLAQPEDRTGSLAAWRSLLETGEEELTFEMRCRCKDGGVRWLHVTGVFVRDVRQRPYRAVVFVEDITEPRNAEERALAAEQALAESEARLRNIFYSDMAPMAFWTHDGRIIEANDAYLKLVGHTREEVAAGLVRWDADRLPEDRAAGDRALAELRSSRWAFTPFERTYVLRDGTRIKMLVSGCLLPGQRYEEAGFAIVLDVTELRQSEAAIRRCEQIFRAIGESIDYGVWVSDADGRNVYASNAFLRMAGIMQEQCSEHGWIETLHPEDRHKVAIFERCVQTGEPFEEELRYLGPQGTVHPVLNRGVPVRDEQGKITAWVGICLDVSKLKRTEEALRESEGRLLAALDEAQRVLAERERLEDELRARERELASLMANSPDVIYRLDLGLRCTFMSPTSGTVMGFPPEHYIGKTPRENGLPPDVIEVSEAACREALATARPQRMEFSLGERRFRARIIPELGPTGTVDSFMGITEDVTAERLAEEERQKLLDSERAARDEAERVSRVKDDFVATLSHELRSPINAILGWARILRGRAPEAQTLARGLEVIERNARLQADMVSELLDMSRIVSGKLRLDVQPVDLPSVIRSALEAIQLAAETKGIAVGSSIDPEASSLRGDPARIHQVVWNLLSNAVKFTPPGGRIDVALRRAGAHAALSVTDTGMGIAPQFLPHLFERFRQADASSTRKHGGLGIGLSIVKHLVELHGGTVEVASRGEHLGATFTVRLPLAGVSQEAPDAAARPSEACAEALADYPGASLAGLRVLVVDDQPDAREVAQRVLEECEATVTTAGSSAEALAILSQERPDVLVSDLGMPGEDGFQLIRRVRGLGEARGGATPAVALSALARAEDKARALGAGYQAHVAKPLDPAELVGVIAALTKDRTGRTNQTEPTDPTEPTEPTNPTDRTSQ